MTVQVRLPDSTMKLVKFHISQREKGQFTKGMIMEFVDRAVKRLLAVEKGELIEQIPQQHTHTKRNSAKNDLLQLNGRIMNDLLSQDGNPDRWMPEKQALNYIKAAAGITDDRPAVDRLELLLHSHYCAQSRSKSGMKLIRFSIETDDTTIVSRKPIQASSTSKRDFHNESKEIDDIFTKWK